METYIGLLTTAGSEPSPETGYTRVKGDPNDTVEFPQTTGFGEVTRIALFEAAEGGEPVEVIALPSPVNCHNGVVPFVHERRLYRGLPVEAKVICGTSSKCDTSGLPR